MKDKGGIILVNPFAEEERMMGAIYSRSEK